MSQRILLRGYIVDEVYKEFGERNKGVSFNFNRFRRDLKDWAKDYIIENPRTKTLLNDFLTGKISVSDKTLQLALTPDSQPTKDGGAVYDLSNLLCYYGCKNSYEDLLHDEFGTDLDTEKIRSDQLKSKESVEYVEPIANESAFKPFDIKPGIFNILILPFRNPENCTQPLVGKELERRLNIKKNKENLTLEVRYHSSYDIDIESDYQYSKKIWKDLNAHIVIWGIDSKIKNKPHQIYFHYVLLNDEPEEDVNNFLAQPTVIETDRIADITEGIIKLEIEDVIFFIMGFNYHFRQDFSAALSNYKKVTHENKLNDILYLLIANCYYNLEDYNKAESFYEKAVKSNKNNNEAHALYARFLHLNTSKYEKAKEHYQISVNLNWEQFETQYYFAKLLHIHFQEYDKSQEHYEYALAINPSSAIVHALLGILFDDKLKKNDRAKEHYQKAISNGGAFAEIHCRYAVILEKEKAFREAIEQFELGLEIIPNDHVILTTYAAFLMRTGDRRGAIKQYEKMIEENPNDAGFYHLIALNYDIINEKELANKYYLIAYDLNPSLKNELQDKSIWKPHSR